MTGRSSRTRARLAQNFLATDAAARRLVAAANLRPGDRVYDLGAGTGRITAALLAVGARVVAVERDPNLARRLRARFEGADVSVVEADWADARLRAPFKVVANPPFNQTAALLRRLLFERPAPESATLILQRGAAERYAGRHLSVVSLTAQPWFQLAVRRGFARHEFVPAPSVDVAVLQLHRRRRPLLDEDHHEPWRAFVGYVVGRSKPDARRSFRNLVSHLQWRRLTQDLAIGEEARLADLTLDQWLGLYRFVRRATPARKQRLALQGAGVRSSSSRAAASTAASEKASGK